MTGRRKAQIGELAVGGSVGDAFDAQQERAAEVVESKRLAETLELIKERQRERTEAKLAKPSTTLRKARLLRAGTQRRTAMGSSSETRP